MRIALFWKYLSLSLAVAAMLVASGCSNCGTPTCAPAPQECVVVGCQDNVTYRPDLYAAVACQNPVASQKTAEALNKALCDATPAKPAPKPVAKPAAPAKPAPAPAPAKVLPPVMPEAKPEPKPVVSGGCLVPADTPLNPADVASYVASEHYGVVEPEITGEPLPPMPTFRGQMPVEPPMDPAP